MDKLIGFQALPGPQVCFFAEKEIAEEREAEEILSLGRCRKSLLICKKFKEKGKRGDGGT
jgi:hypothetical protein